MQKAISRNISCRLGQSGDEDSKDRQPRRQRNNETDRKETDREISLFSLTDREISRESPIDTIGKRSLGFWIWIVTGSHYILGYTCIRVPEICLWTSVSSPEIWSMVQILRAGSDISPIEGQSHWSYSRYRKYEVVLSFSVKSTFLEDFLK